MTLANFGKSLPSELFSNCSSFCLFVCNIDDTGHTVRVINIKLGTYIYLASGYMCIPFCVDVILGDVIRCKNRSDFEIAITQFLARTSIKSSNCRAYPWFLFADMLNFL